jgi:hypothetical protein
MSDYARIAYEAWATQQGWKDGDFADLPPWEELPHELIMAWCAATDAAFNAQLQGDAP